MTILWLSSRIEDRAAADKLDLLPKDKPDVPDIDDTTGHADYLRGRKGYLAEWAEWKADKEGISYEEALADLEANPMFTGSQGGRVKAQGGLFAGQMPGRNPGMNPMGMNPMGMNQGIGAPNLGSRSMGMTPGMGAGMDPRMAQMMQAQKLQGGLRKPIPKESEDTELIQLIKMLTALGIPMEQLRGRTKEELVEMLVAVSGKGKSGTEVIEGEAIEERNGEEVEAAEPKTPESDTDSAYQQFRLLPAAEKENESSLKGLIGLILIILIAAFLFSNYKEIINYVDGSRKNSISNQKKQSIRTEKKSRQPSKVNERKYSLWVNFRFRKEDTRCVPPICKVRIRIMNIRPEFYQGIKLKPGKYDLEIVPPPDFLSLLSDSERKFYAKKIKYSAVITNAINWYIPWRTKNAFL
mgnify:CR=1 FL=1